MSKIKIAAIADVHLMRSQYGNPERRKQIKRSLINAIEAAHNAGAEIILCAGDFLDSNTPGADVAAGDVPDIYELLVDKKMTMYCIKGNHDDIEPSWYGILGSVAAYTQDTDDVYGIQLLPDGKDVILPGGIILRGYDFGSRQRIKALLEEPQSFAGANIVMLHGEIKEWVGYPTENAVSVQDFHSDTYLNPAAIVVGDTHVKRDDVIGNYHVISPGSVDYCSKSELKERKTVTILEFETKGMATPILTEVSEAAYAHTIAMDVTLNTMEDVYRLKTKLASMKEDILANGLLLYGTAYVKAYFVLDDGQLGHGPSIAELRSMLDELGILQQTTLLVQPVSSTEADNTEEQISARAIKEQPDVYFRENADKFVSGCRSAEFMTLCEKMLNSKEDSKKALDDYISDKIGKTVIS